MPFLNNFSFPNLQLTMFQKNLHVFEFSQKFYMNLGYLLAPPCSPPLPPHGWWTFSPEMRLYGTDADPPTKGWVGLKVHANFHSLPRHVIYGFVAPGRHKPYFQPSFRPYPLFPIRWNRKPSLWNLASRYATPYVSYTLSSHVIHICSYYVTGSE